MSGGNQAAVRELAERIDQADAVVIGGGSGLSSAAGYDHYHWSPALAEALAPFREWYGFTSPLAGFYHCFSSYGEQWGYYSQYIRFLWEAPTGQPYLDLQALVADKPAFVLTTNVDRQFFRVFPEEQICAFQGDFGYCQCSQPCRDAIWENQELVKELTGRLVGVRLPEDAVPRCPDCGRVLVPWVRDDTFLEGRVWKTQLNRYHAFLRHWLVEQADKKVLLLELGVGEMTPSIIKLPFWELTARNENVFTLASTGKHPTRRSTCRDAACICKEIWRKFYRLSDGSDLIQIQNRKERTNITDWNLIAKRIKEADAILIGASNGLSITERLHLFADNAAFEELFGDFKRKYGLRCILQGMMARWPNEEEKWAFWARLIHHYCGQYQPTQVMEDLKAIVGDKDYFVVTSNGECHFELCGFDPEKIYEIEGNWLTMQCARPCHDTRYPSLELAEKLAAAEQDGRVPAELVPHCPKCGGPMEIHMGAGERMLPDTAAQERLRNFLDMYHRKKLLVLELGIGWRNQLIKAPLMRLVANKPDATYVTINLGEVYIDPAIRDKSFGLDGRLDELLPKLREACAAAR